MKYYLSHYSHPSVTEITNQLLRKDCRSLRKNKAQPIFAFTKYLLSLFHHPPSCPFLWALLALPHLQAHMAFYQESLPQHASV